MRLAGVLRMLFRWFLVLVLSFPLALQAQKQDAGGFSVSGRIINNEDGQPLEIATIIISNTLWATTDAKGHFVIRQVPAGKYAYEISYLGFKKQTGVLTVDKNIDTLLVRMVPLSLGLDEIVVTARSKKWGRRLPSRSRRFSISSLRVWKICCSCCPVI